MPVAFVDGFDHYPVDFAVIGYGMNSPWNLTGTESRNFVTGLNGLGKAVEMVPSLFGCFMRRVIPSTSQVCYHMAMRIEEFNPTTAMPFVYFQDLSGQNQFHLRLSIGGLIQLVGEGAAVIATGSIILLEGVAYRISFRADLDTGTFELAVNGDIDPNLSLTGVDFQDQATPDIGFAVHGTQATQDFPPGATLFKYIIDDVICIYDETILIPECELLLAGPNADTADSDWVPSTGTDNYAMVDEVPVDGDATYNSSDVVGALDLFDFAGLVKSPESIVCITQLTVARKEESATRTFKNVLKIGATEYPGVEHFLSTSSTYYYDHYRDNPADSLPWEEADYAALKSGYELTV